MRGPLLYSAMGRLRKAILSVGPWSGHVARQISTNVLADSSAPGLARRIVSTLA
jgi:hypothetical protein